MVLKLVSGVLQMFCGPYPNRKYGFSFPVGFWKVVARVPVGGSDLFTLIDFFSWSKIFFKCFIQDLFCWLLTYVYCIYRTFFYWYLNLYSGVLEIFLWAVSKLYMQLRFPPRFVGVSVLWFHLLSSIDWLTSSQPYQFHLIGFGG